MDALINYYNILKYSLSHFMTFQFRKFEPDELADLPKRLNRVHAKLWICCNLSTDSYIANNWNFYFLHCTVLLHIRSW